MTRTVAVFWDYESFLPPIGCVRRGRDAVDQIRRAIGTLGIGKIQQFKIFLDVVADSARGGDAFFHATPIGAGVTLVHCPGDGRMHVASKTMHVDLVLYGVSASPLTEVVVFSGDNDVSFALSTLYLHSIDVILVVPDDRRTHESIKTYVNAVYTWDALEFKTRTPLTDDGSSTIQPIRSNADVHFQIPNAISSEWPAGDDGHVRSSGSKRRAMDDDNNPGSDVDAMDSSSALKPRASKRKRLRQLDTGAIEMQAPSESESLSVGRKKKGIDPECNSRHVRNEATSSVSDLSSRTNDAVCANEDKTPHGPGDVSGATISNSGGHEDTSTLDDSKRSDSSNDNDDDDGTHSCLPSSSEAAANDGAGLGAGDKLEPKPSGELPRKAASSQDENLLSPRNRFKDLIEIIRKRQDAKTGALVTTSALLGARLKFSNPSVYTIAGSKKLKDYLAAACASGVVEMEYDGGAIVLRETTETNRGSNHS